MPPIYYSIEEANEKVKQIKGKIEKIAELNDEIKMLTNVKIEVNDFFEKQILEMELNKSFHEKNVEIYALVVDLLRQGCILRDVKLFEVDFVSRFANRDIMLCWRKGEDVIGFWHEAKENIFKRKPIKLLEKEYYQELEKLK